MTDFETPEIFMGAKTRPHRGFRKCPYCGETREHDPMPPLEGHCGDCHISCCCLCQNPKLEQWIRLGLTPIAGSWDMRYKEE